VLSVRGLEVAYGRVHAVRGAHLEVARGEVVTIVGPNGAGKSSLLRAVAGMVPPRGGRVEFLGEDVTGLPAEALVRRGLVLVPEGRELFSPVSVRDNLRLGAWSRPAAERRRALAADVDHVLDMFPALRARLAQPAATLSGGEQQMLAIGRALLARPRLLLLDEPSVGLAPLVVRAIFAVLDSLKREGLTMLLVEQNARAALRLADRGYALSPGGRLAVVDAGERAATELAYGLRSPDEARS
jgi:branched-chain amino acid transport system ATP-binding protein